MNALLITSFLTLTAYIVYAVKNGVPVSLSASYHEVKKPYLFQIALGVTGILMTIFLVQLTVGKWYQFLSFLCTASLVFVAYAPDSKKIFEGKVHNVAAYLSGIASIVLVCLMGYWYISLALILVAIHVIQKWGNRLFWIEMSCIYGAFLTSFIVSV